MKEHIVKIERGHNCIDFECVDGSERCVPGEGGSHGRSGIGIRFVAKGPEGAVQFLLWTGLYPVSITPDNIGFRKFPDSYRGNIYPADLGYHSKTALYEGQDSMGPCEYCDGEQCFYGGSGLDAHDALYSLVNGGDEGIWGFLDAYYDFVFNGGKYPAPCEYPFARRDAELTEGGER